MSTQTTIDIASKLNGSEKRVRIARICFPEFVEVEIAYWYTQEDDYSRDWVFRHVTNDGHNIRCEVLPDYLNDRDAMAGAVALLNDQQQHAYAVVLAGMLWLDHAGRPNNRGWETWRDTLAISQAAAAQQADAFLIAAMEL